MRSGGGGDGLRDSTYLRKEKSLSGNSYFMFGSNSL